ncbi:MAG: hypothetical protein ABUL41_01035 [Chitinophagaceae bacterium]
MNDYLINTTLARPLLQRVFFAAVLFIFIYYYFNHLFVSQIGLNPILFQEIDPSYWLLMILKIPQLIAGTKIVSILFDLTLVISAIISFLKPSQSTSVKVFYVFYFLYYMLFNLLAGHHYVNIGILVTALPFMFSRNEKFAFLFACSRYYFLFMFTSAALWKLWRGSLFHNGQLVTFLQKKKLLATISGDTSLTSQIDSFVLTHKELALATWIVMGMLELSFIIGFFSYKYDKILVANYILFLIGSFFIVDIVNIENLLMLLTLFPIIKIVNRINGKLIPAITT